MGILFYGQLTSRRLAPFTPHEAFNAVNCVLRIDDSLTPGQLPDESFSIFTHRHNDGTIFPPSDDGITTGSPPCIAATSLKVVSKVDSYCSCHFMPPTILKTLYINYLLLVPNASCYSCDFCCDFFPCLGSALASAGGFGGSSSPLPTITWLGRMTLSPIFVAATQFLDDNTLFAGTMHHGFIAGSGRTLARRLHPAQ